MKPRLYYILIIGIIICGSACKQNTNNGKQFHYMQALIKHVFPATNVVVDTIAENSRLSDFVYKTDSVWLKNFFVPLYPEYSKTENGNLTPVTDTPLLIYGNKQWQLPMEWKTEKLGINYLFHIKTKTKKYLVIVLDNSQANAPFSWSSKIGWVDIDNGNGFCFIDGYYTAADNFVDYDNDGELEFLKIIPTKIDITDKFLKQHFILNICRPTENPKQPAYVVNKNGEPISVCFYDSEGELYLTEELNK
jgi:hypothetical protein